MKKRILSLALASAMTMSLLPTASLAAGTQYDDINDHWAESSIERWSEYNIVEGDEGHFRPDRALTRGEMAKIIANTLGLTDEGEGNPFDDVSDDAWYAPYVLRCYVAGIMEGTEGHANPENTITRQETMTILGRAFGLTPAEGDSLSDYGDAGDVADWAKGYVAAMTKAGIVNGVGENSLAPLANIDRASVMTILDRSVTTYINAPGTYELPEDGFVLVACGGVTLTGKSAADILVTPAASGEKITFKNATVTGSITVQGDKVKVVNNNSKLPTIKGEGVTVSKPSSGGGGGSSSRAYESKTIETSGTLNGNDEGASAIYQSVTIAAAVGNGTVTLKNLTILGDLTILGGGSSTVNLENCTVGGRIILNKDSSAAGAELPRLNLKNTDAPTVEVLQPGKLEGDSSSDIGTVNAKADVYVQGNDTTVTTIVVEGDETITVDVQNSTVNTVEAKSETYVTGNDTAVVSTVVATADVNVASGTVENVTVPDSAANSVSVAVNGSGSVDVTVNSNNGVDITTSGGASATVSTDLDETPTGVTQNGTEVDHIHKWSEGTVTNAPTCTQTGEKTYTCTADGCTGGKTEVIAKLGHDWGAWEINASAVDEHICFCKRENCTAYESEAHVWRLTATTAPTCTDDGTKSYNCIVCAATKEEKGEEKLGHKVSENATYVNTDDTYHWHICENAGCGEQVDKAEHIWNNGEVTTQPTETTEGVKTYTCTVCGKTKTESIAVVSGDEHNGFDIEWTIEDNDLYGTITVPESASTSDSYTFYIYNSKTREHTYFCSYMTSAKRQMYFSAKGTYDRVRLYAGNAGSYTDDNYLADWELTNEIVGTIDEVNFPYADNATEVTISVTYTVENDTEKYTYSVSGIDSEHYTYMMKSEKGGIATLKTGDWMNAEVYKKFEGAVTLYAEKAEQDSDGTFKLTRTKSITVTIPEATPASE